MRIVIACLVVLVLASLATAQPVDVVPFQYRLTRTSPAPVQFSTFPLSAMTCGLPVGPPSATGLRITNPQNQSTDCELLGTVNGVIVPKTAGVTPSYSIAASDAAGVVWTVEVPGVLILTPSVPAPPRVRPGASALAFGTVQQTFPYALPNGDVIAVATATLDETGAAWPVHFGAWTLTIPNSLGYTIGVGDKIAYTFWRP